MVLELQRNRRSLVQDVRNILEIISQAVYEVLPASAGAEAADGADFEPPKRPLIRLSMVLFDESDRGGEFYASVSQPHHYCSGAEVDVEFLRYLLWGRILQSPPFARHMTLA